jgi:hypothetical protein
MEKGTIPLSIDLAGKVQMGGRRRKMRGGAVDNEMIEMKLGEDEANEADYELLDKISGGRRRRTKRKRTKKGGRKTRRRKTKSRRRRNK